MTFCLTSTSHQANGEATFTNGPRNPSAERVRKRRRTSSPHHTPEIHVHVSNPPTTAAPPPPPPPPVLPMDTYNPPPITPSRVPAPAVDIIDLTDLPSSDEDDDDNIIYPLVLDLLAELDQRYPGVQYMQYSQRMLEAGFSRVNQIRDSRRTRQVLLNIAIPPVVVNQIISRAQRLQRRSEKQSADMQTVKMEDV